MHPAIAPALFTFCTSLAMAFYVVVRRYKEPIHWMLIGYLVGIAIWTAGVIDRYSITTNERLVLSFRLVFVGILVSSSFWVLMALIQVRRRARALANTALVLFVVSSLFALGLFTNDGHRLFLRTVDLEVLESGPRAYVGPLFWAFVPFVYGCVLYGMVVYLRAARSMLTDSRRRALMLALASAIPTASSSIYVFQLLPIPYDLTPSGLMLAVILLSLAVFRYQLLESLPLARDAVLEHLEDGVVMASASGRITEWNPAAAQILGDSGLRRGARLADVLARSLPRPDGRAIEATTALVDEGRGEPAGQFAILCDRSEIDRAEQLARQVQRLEIVGALAGEVAHHINDPLTYVRSNLVEIERLGGCVETSSTGPDAELAAELADLRSVALEALEGIERIRRIVDGMRELSSADRGGFGPVDLGSVARDAARLARLGTAAGACPAIQLRLSPVPPVHGNADRLVQVVINLLVNARQALAHTPDPRIEVHTEHRNGEVQLTVIDNGPGIAEELRHRIFDPFFTTRGPDEGTGLGLAIAFDIAREHGGALEAHSLPAGGARFLLRLPAMGGRTGEPPGGRGTGREVESHSH